jgi:HEAT repeat protein
MLRILVLVISLAAAPALAFDLEKWADDLANRQMEKWKKEKLETAVKGRDPKARLEAVEGLSYADPDALAAFAIALGDSDARVRRAAASQMWSAEKKAEPYRAHLTKALDDPDPNVVAYAAGALQAQGVKEAELVAPRKRILDSGEASVTSRYYAARSLVGHEPPRKIAAAMIEYLEQNAGNAKNVELVEKSLERLVRITKDRNLIDPLLAALVETRNAHVPLLKTLGTFEPKPEGWTRILVKHLEHANPRVRYEALTQMRSVKEERDIAVWVPRAAAMLQDPDSSVRSEALWALGSARGLAAGEVDKVVAAMTENPALRRNGLRTLGAPSRTRTRTRARRRPTRCATSSGAARAPLPRRSSPLRPTNRQAWRRCARARWHSSRRNSRARWEKSMSSSFAPSSTRACRPPPRSSTWDPRSG